MLLPRIIEGIRVTDTCGPPSEFALALIIFLSFSSAVRLLVDTFLFPALIKLWPPASCSLLAVSMPTDVPLIPMVLHEVWIDSRRFACLNALAASILS